MRWLRRARSLPRATPHHPEYAEAHAEAVFRSQQTRPHQAQARPELQLLPVLAPQRRHVSPHQIPRSVPKPASPESLSPNSVSPKQHQQRPVPQPCQRQATHHHPQHAEAHAEAAHSTPTKQPVQQILKALQIQPVLPSQSVLLLLVLQKQALPPAPDRQQLLDPQEQPAWSLHQQQCRPQARAPRPERAATPA